MLSLLMLQVETFLLIMAVFVVLMSILHIVSVFRLKSGKIVSSERGLILFGVSLAYIITVLICGM